MAAPVDGQIAEIFASLELPADWQRRIAIRASEGDGPSLDELRTKKRRLARAYADGGFSLADYEARMAAVDAEILLIESDAQVESAEVAALLRDLPAL
ncbi:MAG: hypothetical protein FJZ92_03600 [Chloroflexi bacterium]|nr:hypothetical protein [Chloroflexota bacterium]MBM4419843.1 hypothetical protein [Chloroflexota bacterium]